MEAMALHFRTATKNESESESERERERETEGGRERERIPITAAIEHNNNNNNNSGTAQTRNLLTSKFGQPTESGSQLQKSPYIFLAMYKYMSVIKKA